MRKGGQLLAYVHRNHCFAFYIHILVILAFISGYIAFLSSFLTQDRSQSLMAHFGAIVSNGSVVSVSASLTAVSPNDYTITVQVELLSEPRSWLSVGDSLNHTFVLGIGGQEYRITSTNQYSAITATLPITKGSFDLYPFDEYEAEVELWVYDGDSFYTSNVDIAVNVNKAIIYGYTPSLKTFWHNDTTDNRLEWRDVGDLAYVLKINRTSVFMLYPVFQIVAFWLIGLSFCIFTSVTVLWNKRRIEGPVMAGSIGLIFALPAFRNTAPGSPPIGCTLDVCSFYWAMIFVVLCFIGLVARYLITAPPPPPQRDIQPLLGSILAKVNEMRGHLRERGAEEKEGTKLHVFP